VRNRPFGLMAVLIAIWLFAWGSISWANVLSGIAVAIGLMIVLPDIRHADHLPIVRPVPLARLVLRMLRDVVVSNLVLARQVLSRRPHVRTGVVRVPLAGCSSEVVTIVASLVALTPGITAIEVVQHPTVMYVHVLNLDDPEEVRRSIWSLRDQVLAAFGTRRALADVAEVKAEALRRSQP